MLNDVDNIIAVTERIYNIPKNSIREYCRKSTVANARAVSMYIIKQTTMLSYEEISCRLKRDSSGIKHNCKKAIRLLKQPCHLSAYNDILREIA